MANFIVLSAVSNIFIIHIFICGVLCINNSSVKQQGWRNFKSYDETIFANTKRDKTLRKFDKIQLIDDVNNLYHKKMEDVYQNAQNDFELNEQHRVDQRYSTYADKYGKTKNEDMTKNKKKKRKKKGNDKCMYKNEDVYKCIGLLVSRNLDGAGVLAQSINGSALELASTFIVDEVRELNMFSNKARGSYSNDYDVGLMYTLNDESQTLARMRYEVDNNEARVVYILPSMTSDSHFSQFSPFVTDMSVSKTTLTVDSYNLFNPANGLPSFFHVGLNSKTGEIVQTYGRNSGCYDILFGYNDEHARWICVGEKPEVTVYIRDPSTGINYVPPDNANPYINFTLLLWLTSARVCGQNYFAGFGFDFAAGQYQFVRTKVSTKYPYFLESELFYVVDQTAVVYPGNYIHSPPDTNILYACYHDRFMRFDNVYTAPVPLEPTVDTHMQGIANTQILRIVSFRECPDQVYALTYDQLLYSDNGGRSFVEVDQGSITYLSFSADLTGFCVKNI